MAYRIKRFGFVLSPDERLCLERLAEMKGLSEASVIRSLILREAREHGIWQDIVLARQHESNMIASSE